MLFKKFWRQFFIRLISANTFCFLLSAPILSYPFSLSTSLYDTRSLICIHVQMYLYICVCVCVCVCLCLCVCESLNVHVCFYIYTFFNVCMCVYVFLFLSLSLSIYIYIYTLVIWFNGISTFDGYLVPNLVYTYIIYDFQVKSL